MALQKTFTLPSGVSGNYIRLTAHRWDRQAREAVAWFALYVDAAAATSGKAPLTPFIAKLWLTSTTFDDYLAPAALENSSVLAQLYVAAKAEPISCDFGSNAFADALDV
ncbi:MAG: hypothetical protein FJ184_02030 [Gammaproteobacteria bacterium]|nr:hypothetical protein [Gammaproteobacteria bacterium]